MTPPVELPMVGAKASGVEAATLRVPESEEVRRFRVDGMDCGACAKTVEKSVATLVGVASAEVSFGTASMVVAGDVSDADVMRAVSRAGYRAQTAERAADDEEVPFWRRDARAIVARQTLWQGC